MEYIELRGATRREREVREGRGDEYCSPKTRHNKLLDTEKFKDYEAEMQVKEASGAASKCRLRVCVGGGAESEITSTMKVGEVRGGR